MPSRTYFLYTIFSLSILDIYLGFCHKFNRAYIIYDDFSCSDCGMCYKKLVSAGGYVPRIESIETLLLLMTIFMVVITRYAYHAIKKGKPSKHCDTVMCFFSILQMNIVLFAIGCFLQDGGWKLAKEMISMMERNELCDGFANRSTNRFFLSFGLFLAEITLSFLICICTQLLIIFEIRERNDRFSASRPETNNDTESYMSDLESQKLFSYAE